MSAQDKIVLGCKVQEASRARARALAAQMRVRAYAHAAQMRELLEMLDADKQAVLEATGRISMCALELPLDPGQPASLVEYLYAVLQVRRLLQPGYIFYVQKGAGINPGRLRVVPTLEKPSVPASFRAKCWDAALVAPERAITNQMFETPTHSDTSWSAFASGLALAPWTAVMSIVLAAGNVGHRDYMLSEPDWRASHPQHSDWADSMLQQAQPTLDALAHE